MTKPTPGTIAPSPIPTGGKTPIGPLPGSVPLFGGGAGASTAITVLENRQMRNLVIPPGGFVAFGSQTPATQALFQRAGRMGGLRSASKRRRKTSKRKTTATRKRKTTARRKPARLVKGSAAAKRYMASIRRKRRR